ncbi:MAG: pirin family protein [Chloracidobacterium sp.]|nr:pirin family protein [Chloracidobacterium sp.]
MIKIRRSKERGHANHGWLDTRYTFSFSDYYDPQFMGFRDLRVINEDFIEPDQGFPKHGHRDMEIITYMISGELSHRDSMGNGETIKPNEVQRMTAGTGVLHSEYSSPTDKTHLLQIWILPEENRLTPGYEQKLFAAEGKQGKLKLIASRGGDDGSVHINQDVKLYASVLAEGKSVSHDIADGRHAWVQLISGALDVNGYTLEAGDGAAISEETKLKLTAHEDNTEFLFFDLK